MRNIYDLSREELSEYLKSISEPAYRAEQIFTALHGGTEIAEINNIPKTLRTRVSADFYTYLPKIVKERVSTDGTKKYLLDIDGEGTLIECVFLPQDYGNTACVSSQVGCRMGCAFCASGKNGLVRNLSAGEILSQVLLLNKLNKGDKDRSITNIVIMGSGEPFDNFDNTIAFLRLVTAAGGINIGARNISVSTAGLADKIREFADLDMQVNLCISLHAPNDTIRKTVMPVANRFPIGELIDAAKYFYKATHRRVIFEYSLIEGVNCETEHAVELANLVKGFPAHVNLINMNPHDYSALQPPTRDKALKFMDKLIKSGVSTTMRKSRGADIEGACGQLKLQNAKK
jgi:23S rRNA (adenine2503-C2)-methyltransferase